MQSFVFPLVTVLAVLLNSSPAVGTIVTVPVPPQLVAYPDAVSQIAQAIATQISEAPKPIGEISVLAQPVQPAQVPPPFARPLEPKPDAVPVVLVQRPEVAAEKPQALPQGDQAPQIPPASEPAPAPQRAPEPVPQRAPEPVPQRAPESAPLRAPESAPQRAPESVPQRAPESPESVPQRALGPAFPGARKEDLEPSSPAAQPAQHITAPQPAATFASVVPQGTLTGARSPQEPATWIVSPPVTVVGIRGTPSSSLKSEVSGLSGHGNKTSTSTRSSSSRSKESETKTETSETATATGEAFNAGTRNDGGWRLAAAVAFVAGACGLFV